MSEAMTDRDVCESITKQAGNGPGQARLMAKLRTTTKAFDEADKVKRERELPELERVPQRKRARAEVTLGKRHYAMHIVEI